MLDQQARIFVDISLNRAKSSGFASLGSSETSFLVDETKTD